MRDKKKDGKKVKEEAGVEGRGESEGQKDRSCDKSGGRRRGGDGFNTSVVCFSGPAGKRGMELLKHFTRMN